MDQLTWKKVVGGRDHEHEGIYGKLKISLYLGDGPFFRVDVHHDGKFFPFTCNAKDLDSAKQEALFFARQVRRILKQA